jgi:hypothetical protein
MRAAEGAESIVGAEPAGGWCTISSAVIQEHRRRGHVTGMPTRSQHARGAVAPGDTSGCPRWVA